MLPALSGMLPDSRCAASIPMAQGYPRSMCSRQNAANGEQNARAPHANARFCTIRSMDCELVRDET
jgi:hypothetical protein